MTWTITVFYHIFISFYFNREKSRTFLIFSFESEITKYTHFKRILGKFPCTVT